MGRFIDWLMGRPRPVVAAPEPVAAPAPVIATKPAQQGKQYCRHCCQEHPASHFIRPGAVTCRACRELHKGKLRNV